MRNYLFLSFLFGCMFHGMGQYVDRTFFKAGFHAAATLGDASDAANLGIGVDLYQHWGISKKFDLGLTSGVMYFFGLESTEDIGPVAVTTRGEDTVYVPIGALVRYYPTASINFGTDVGYTVGLNDFSQSGLYYRPTVGIDLTTTTALTISFMGVEFDDGRWNQITAGIVFRF